MSIFRIAHLSDPHLPPPAGAFGWRDLVSKRLLSRIAWRRKHKEHQPDVLAALVADIKTYAPDHIAVTGDLTNFASTVEVEAARKWLSGLGASDRITLSPGNHDALVGAVGPERFVAWSDWLGDGDEFAFPRLRIRDGVAIINLCSAIPTAPHLATGRLGQAQLARLEALLADPAHRDLFRVILIHHPPTPGAVSRRKSLDDRDALRAILARHGADLVLHGHAHEGLVATMPGPDGTAIPVLGVPSASALGRGKHPAARWHAIEITRDGADAVSVRVIARGLDPQTGDVTELGRYVLA
ncbi:metallophosphoesterase family protein [Caulobacter sp. ErkDOM-YI]|uniref:metallophosphoesterase family protein n=1 Tax=unclassified Caulobacter TaxID=2648921 RepID=UPI003AF93463